jgi:hypothetical protein
VKPPLTSEPRGVTPNVLVELKGIEPLAS